MLRWSNCVLIAVFVMPISMMSGGCTKSMTPGKMQWVRTDSDQPHAGNAYLLRGWLGIFSEGMDNLTRQINNAGVRAHVYQDDQWSALAAKLRDEYKRDPNHEPLVLVGHSYGADDSIRVARELQKDNITVDLLVTLDAVTPPRIPSNVKRCINIYQPNPFWDSTPWFRGIPLTRDPNSTTALVNYNVRADRTDLLEPNTDHFNIEKNQKIHAEILGHVLETCPPRQQWVAAHHGYANAVVAGARSAPIAPAHPSNLSTSGRPVAVRQGSADRSSTND